MSRPITWHAQRLRSMSPAEVAARARDAALRQTWSRAQVSAGESATVPPGTHGLREFGTTIPDEVRARMPALSREAVVAAAEAVLGGEWAEPGTQRPDTADPVLGWYWLPFGRLPTSSSRAGRDREHDQG